MPEVVEAEIWASADRGSLLDVARDRGGPRLAPVGGREQRGLPAGRRELFEVVLDHRDQVGRNREVAETGLRLGRLDLDLVVHPAHAAAHLDHASPAAVGVVQLDVLAAQLGDLAPSAARTKTRAAPPTPDA